MNETITCEFVNSMNQVKKQDWNCLVPTNYPFLRHEFLNALEQSQCASINTGWMPQHIVIRNSECGSLLGAAPLYLKNHSWGEYIFDWDWANGYKRHGLRYYPKLVSQTPFTPISAPKLLANSNCGQIRQTLIDNVQSFADQHHLSSVHWLFLTEQDADTLQNTGLIARESTIEYVWNNVGYHSMDEFLNTLSSRKRKKIKRERKSVDSQGLVVEPVQGADMNEAHWSLLDQIYQQTTDKYGAVQYLSSNFFRMIGDAMADNIVFFVASIGKKPVAGSFCLQGGGNFYGRYWGALQHFDCLHFEVCYYAAIEYCIKHRLNRYSAGIQGSHKLNRGFLPQLSQSAHFFRHPGFAKAVNEYISHESSDMKQYRKWLMQSAPYSKKNTPET